MKQTLIEVQKKGKSSIIIYPLNTILFKKKNALGYSRLNGVIVSGGQRRESAIHTHVSILPRAPLPSRLPHSIEQSSLCSTAGRCC